MNTNNLDDLKHAIHDTQSASPDPIFSYKLETEINERVANKKNASFSHITTIVTIIIAVLCLIATVIGLLF